MSTAPDTSILAQLREAQAEIAKLVRRVNEGRREIVELEKVIEQLRNPKL